MIRVLIADDHPVVRKGLRQIMSRDPEISVVDEATDGYEALEKVRSNSYSVLVLDISMPGLSGIEVLKQITSENVGVPVLILSVHSEDQYAVRVLKAGAAGYITKESAPEELINAIKKLYAGQKYISPGLAEKLASYVGRPEDGLPHETLSDREFTILCRIAGGKTIKEIAGELTLSVKTVHTYRTRILRKMHMKTNAELTSYVVANGLFPDL